MATPRSIKRIKLTSVRPHADPVEVELPPNVKIEEAGFAEGIYNLWVSYDTEGDPTTVKLKMLEDGGEFDPDEFELIHTGVRPSGRAVGLLKAL